MRRAPKPGTTGFQEEDICNPLLPPRGPAEERGFSDVTEPRSRVTGASGLSWLAFPRPARSYPGRSLRQPCPFPLPAQVIRGRTAAQVLLPAPALRVLRLARCAPPPPWPDTIGSGFQAPAIGPTAHRALVGVVRV